MTFKQFTMACAAAGMIAVPAERASADAGDVAAGVLLGVIGSAVVRNGAKQQRRTTTRRVVRRGIPSTSEGVQLQTALNYFGYSAGRVDGQIGRGTRNAVSRYQSSLGYVADGYIDPHEQSTLLGAYNWAINGGASTANGLGGTALLREYQQRLATNTLYSQPQQQQPVYQQNFPATTAVTLAPQVQPQQLQPQLPAATTVTSVVPAAPAVPEEPVAVASGGLTTLPTFMGATQSVSLASHCNQISLVTSTNGGFTRSDNLVDANFALNEQFCLARTYAIAEGEQLVSAIQGFSPEQIQAQCEGFGPAMKDYVSALSLKPAEAVIQDVGTFVLNSGLSPQQLSGTAKICLSVGYRIDDMDVAVGSALLLAALGEPVYGELMGHHLTQGFGTSKRNDLSLAWYEMGLSAVENGAVAVFAPGQPERNTLIRKAAYMVGDNRQGAARPTVQPVGGAALPTFNANP